MRWAPIVCGSLAAALAGRAAALSCGTPFERLYEPFATAYQTRVFDDEYATRLPVDAWPWSLENCVTAPDELCVLRSGEEVIPVTLEATGREACEALDEAPLGIKFFIRHFVPEQVLAPAQTYTLDCGEPPIEQRIVVTRASAASSAPPGRLSISGARALRAERGCCGVEKRLEVQIEGLAGAYLDEGGYVEVMYPQGDATTLGAGEP